jgi:hypothetical protein
LARHSRSLALTDFNRLTADRQRFDDTHPYAALCNAASEAIVVNDGTDDRFSISIRTQAYQIGIVILFSAASLKAGSVRRCWQDTLRKSDKPLMSPAHNRTIF